MHTPVLFEGARGRLTSKLSDIIHKHHDTSAHSHHMTLSPEIRQWLTGRIMLKLHELTQKFPNASVQYYDALSTICVDFHACEEFPVPAKFYFEIEMDHDKDLIIISSSILILPVLTDYERNRDLELTPESPDKSKLDEFLTKTVGNFSKIYQEVHEHDSPYMQQRTVIDPVCELRMLQSDAESSASYGGKNYFFCSIECSERFYLTPQMFTQRLTSQ